MKKIITYAFLAVFTVSITSCATILSGSHQTVKVATYPPGADVYVEGENVGKTPTEITLKKGFHAENVVVKKEGFENKNVPLKTTLNPVAILNLFGLIGWGIDAATGSMMKYDKKYYEITLDAKPAITGTSSSK